MHHMVQLQQQIQRIQQEVNNINQVCSQLQQSEQANALQLQQMTQKELFASQSLRRIQQAARQLSQEISQISSVAQQMSTTPALGGAFQGTGTYSSYAGSAGIQPQTGFGVNASNFGAGSFAGTQYGLGTSQPGLNQGQNLLNIGHVPNINLSNFNSQLNPSQGYINNNPGTGNSFGYSNQGTASAFGGTQAYGSAQGLTGFTGNQNIPAGNLMNTLSPAVQNASSVAGSQGLNQSTLPGQGNIGQTSAGTFSYTPYQANQFGFR